jgi:hypothetical protein
MLRQSPLARRTGQTNKTLVGARRRSILVSLLESLWLFPNDR